MNINKILVVGGSGMLGRPVVRRLLHDGCKVSVGSRSATIVTKLFGDSVTPVEFDITDLDSVKRALTGHDAVHLNLPSGPKFEDCFTNDYRGAKSISIVAKECGIKRISYLSGSTVTQDSPFQMVRAKWLAEQSIRNSGVPYTIWRATWFMESLDKLVKFIFIARLGGGLMKVHWLAADDFATMVSRSFQSDRASAKILYPFGPEPISFNDAIKLYRKLRHPYKLIIPMSIKTAIRAGERLNNWEMWFGAQLMSHFEEIPELGDPTETFDIVGEPQTTLTDFCCNRNA